MKQVMRYLVAAVAAGCLSSPSAVCAGDQPTHAQAATVGAAEAPVAGNVLPAVDAVRRAPQTQRGNLDPMRGPVATTLPPLPRDMANAPSDAPYHTWTGSAPN